jgi:hypothetical protein
VWEIIKMRVSGSEEAMIGEQGWRRKLQKLGAVGEVICGQKTKGVRGESNDSEIEQVKMSRQWKYGEVEEKVRGEM